MGTWAGVGFSGYGREVTQEAAGGQGWHTTTPAEVAGTALLAEALP